MVDLEGGWSGRARGVGRLACTVHDAGEGVRDDFLVLGGRCLPNPLDGGWLEVLHPGGVVQAKVKAAGVAEDVSLRASPPDRGCRGIAVRASHQPVLWGLPGLLWDGWVLRQLSGAVLVVLLVVEAAGIAEGLAEVILPPQWRRGGLAVGANTVPRELGDRQDDSRLEYPACFLRLGCQYAVGRLQQLLLWLAVVPALFVGLRLGLELVGKGRERLGQLGKRRRQGRKRRQLPLKLELSELEKLLKFIHELGVGGTRVADAGDLLVRRLVLLLLLRLH